MLVPDGWKSRKLGEICKIKTGNKNNDDKIENGLYPFFVRSQNIERINSYSYEGEAILVPGEGRIGEIYHYVNGKFDCHQRVYRISNFLYSISSKYIYYFLRHNFKKQAVEYSVKSTVDSLRLPTFQTFKVLIPPLLEQKAIVGILSTWDKFILQLIKLIEAKRQRKKALMQRLLTGKQRLQGFDGQDWREFPLEEIADVIISTVDKKSHIDEIPVRICNYKDVYYNDYITNDFNFMKATATPNEIKKFRLKQNDVVITKDCDIAIPALVSESLEGVICGYHLSILRPHATQTCGAFLCQVFSLPTIRYYFFTLANGVTRSGLSVAAISKAKLSLPSLEEQNRIATILSTADSEITQLEQKLDTYHEQKKGLMQQLLTGKKRVRLKRMELSL